MADFATHRERYSQLTLSLSSALESGDEVAFGNILDQMVQLREKKLFLELKRLTADLQGALERFRVDSRLVDIAEKEVPDALYRLDHVLKLTAEAAHRTMDLVEQSAPIAEKTSKAAADLGVLWKRFREGEIASHDFRQLLDDMDRFLEITQNGTEQMRKNLTEVILTQGYQDLTGQIIRGVMKLVSELEIALTGLVGLSKVAGADEDRLALQARGYGPAVPGVDHGAVVDGQGDVDSLLSGLGI